MFGQIWRILFHVNKSPSVNKWIVWILLSISNFNSLICIERSGKSVAIYNSEDTAVEFNVDTYVKVFPGVNFNTIWFRDQMTFQENSLRDA
jgi:hypothetical protein